MSKDAENTKILIVDTAPAMLEVLKNFAGRNGYDMDGYSDPAVAATALNSRFQQFSSDYRCVMLGWPQGDAGILQELISSLSSPDHKDLPLLVVCQEETAELTALVKRRGKTRTLLWKDYQNASEIIDRLPVARIADSDESEVQDTAVAVAAKPGKRALLIDSAPSICHSLRQMMQNYGYQVTVANAAMAGRERLQAHRFDLIVTDYHLHGQQSEPGLEQFIEVVKKSNPAAVLAVVSAKYTDAVIKHSLTAGAATCLFKSESTELLFTRIDALTKNFVKHAAVQSTPEKEDDVQPSEQPAELKQEVIKPVVVSKAGTDKSRPVVVKVELAAKPDVDPAPETAAAATESLPEKSPPASSPVKSPEKSPENSPVSLQAASPQPPQSSPPAAAAPEVPVVEPVHLPIDKPEFEREVQQILQSVADDNHKNIRYSVLMLDLQLVAATGDRLSIGDSEPMRKIVLDRLSRLYKRENSMSYLGDGQIAFIIASRKQQDTLRLTRKVLEVVPRMIRYLSNMGLVSHAGLVQIDGSCTETADLLSQCRAACARARRDQRDNCALVLPLRKYLTAQESEAAA